MFCNLTRVNIFYSIDRKFKEYFIRYWDMFNDKYIYLL